MKNLLLKLNFGLYFCLLPFTAYAQDATASATPNPTPPDKVVVEQPAWLSGAENLAQTIFAARAASLAVYPSYDPYIAVGGVKKPWGFGASLLYPVSNYAFAGVRLDFLGNSFWAPSAVVGAKYTLQNVPTTPTVFTVAGLIMPLGGAGDQNRVAGAVTGVGATFSLYHSRDGNFSINAFVEGEKWTNFEGVIVHPGIAGAIKF
jgi:hypothetical protein